MNTPALSDPPPLRLKDLIKQVRRELEEAVEEHQKSGRPAMFQVEGLTLEINVTVKRDESLSAEAGAALFVATGRTAAEKSTGAETVHKVTVQLAPHRAEDAPADKQADGLGILMNVPPTKHPAGWALSPLGDYFKNIPNLPEHPILTQIKNSKGWVICDPQLGQQTNLSASDE